MLEIVAWYFLNIPMEIYDSIIAKKAICEELSFAEGLSEGEIIEESEEPLSMTEEKKEHKGNITPTSSIDLYKKGSDDYYEKQAAYKKEQLDKIAEYIHYIMAPFIKQEDLESFCNEIMSFAINPNYDPKPFVGLKGTFTSFDVRHLVWSIAIRLGLGKGKVYSNDDCACYIERRLASLCVTASGEPLSHSTLRNLTVTSNSDQIHCDIQREDGLLFHIPSQLGIK